MADNWLDQKHPHYAKMIARETFTWDHYTGEALDVARDEARKMGAGGKPSILQLSADQITHKIRSLLRVGDPTASYLLRRAQGEALAAYYERLMISRFPRHFARIVGTMVGGISTVESKAERSWGELGDPDDPGTFMYAFWRNTDGKGTNYPALVNEMLTRLIVSHHQWDYVEPQPGLPRIVLLDTPMVEDWLEDDDRLKEVKVREVVDVRESIAVEYEGKKAFTDNWILYDEEGFERFAKVKGKAVSKGRDEWQFPFFTDADRDVKRLPIAHNKAPLSIDAGYRVAQTCNALFNLHSDVRWLLRVANHPRLRGKDVTKDQWELIRAEMADGGNTLLGDFDFINPDPSNAKVGYDIYGEEVREAYIEMFQTYEDAARERTATEIHQEDNKGRRSILSVFSDAIDEVENDLIFRVEQTQFPNEPSKWGKAFVKRSDDFKPLDPEATADRILREQFPGGIEWPEAIEIELRKKILEGYAVEIEKMDEVLKEAVALSRTRRAQARAVEEELALDGLPA